MLRNSRGLFSLAEKQAHHRLKSMPKLFVRQGLTQTDPEEQKQIQLFMDWISKKPVHLHFGNRAKSDQDFREEYEKMSGKPFTAENFRSYRMDLLVNQTDGFVFYWGKALSVSGGFEAGVVEAMRMFEKKDMPLFFAVREPIKTTLLRDLPNATYCNFTHPKELNAAFDAYLKNITLTLQGKHDRLVDAPQARNR